MKFYAVLPFVLQALAWPVVQVVFRLTGTFKVIGFENIKNLKHPLLFASNHPNEIDPIVTRAMLPMLSNFAPMFWVARPRKDYTWQGWRGWLYGDWFFKSWGAYPAYKGHKDYVLSLRHHIQILKDGHSLTIFPQVTIGVKMRDTTRQHEAHGGVVFLAQHLHIPIIPITIKGTYGLNAKKLFFGKPQIEVVIGEPLYINDEMVKNGVEDYKKISQSMMNQIYEIVEQ